MRLQKVIALALVSTLIPSMAFAQNYDPGTGPDQPSKDARPKPPRPIVVDPTNPVEQAGTGGTIAYSEAGVIELGGSAGFRIAGDSTSFTFKPQVGYFIADNFQVSALIDFTYNSIDPDGDANDASSLLLSALIEPSYHLPFTDAIFGFVGLGIGAQYSTASAGDIDSDANVGFALVPRLGANFLIGRSGILTPAINIGYSTLDVDNVGGNSTLLTTEVSIGGTVGYTIMW